LRVKGTQDREFFGFDFEFCNVSLLVMLKGEGFVKKQFLIGPQWEEVGLFRVVLRLRGIKIAVNLGKKIFLFKSYMTPFIFAKNCFSKIRSIN
jgi:hypothetical protein